MKVTFKDLKQQKFTLDVEPSDKISSVKEKISAEKGWEAAGLKLIYSGKILQDDNTVESYKVEEKGFIVCMTSKPKPAPKASAASTAATLPSTPAPATQVPSTPAAPAAVPSSITTQVPSTPSPAPISSSATFNDPSALATGDERAAAIANMESMGFPRTEIDRAMRAAFFNPDRAVEYLLNGIPESAQAEQAAARPAAAQTQGTDQPATAAVTSAPQGGDEPVNLFEAAAAAGRGGAPRTGGAETITGGAAGTQNLDFLRSNPQFQQLRTVVQQQPQMLEPILQQVAAGNPQLAQMITQNTEEFMRLLAEDGDGEEGEVQLPPGLQQIAVSEEERDAIERVCLSCCPVTRRRR